MIRFSCRQCGKGVRVPDTFAGKKGRCPFCKVVMDIPSPTGASPEDALAALAGAADEQDSTPPPRPPSSLDDISEGTELELDLALGGDPSDKTDVLEALDE